jgi:hypothetical protein
MASTKRRSRRTLLGGLLAATGLAGSGLAAKFAPGAPDTTRLYEWERAPRGRARLGRAVPRPIHVAHGLAWTGAAQGRSIAASRDVANRDW